MKTLIAALIVSSLSGCAIVTHEQMPPPTVVNGTQTETEHKLICNPVSPFQECERAAMNYCPQGFQVVENTYEWHAFAPSGRVVIVRCTGNIASR